jgi:hypothetical protein
MKMLVLLIFSLFQGPIPQFDQLEFSPPITTTASNPYLPYDSTPLLKVTPGATVDALYLSPGADTWRVVPCFWYQPMEEVEGAFLPVGEAEWRCRFAPDAVGRWTYKVRITDTAGTRETPTDYFDCVASQSKGFIGISAIDSRFFEFRSGTPFLTPLINLEDGNPFNGLERSRTNLASLGAVRFVRWFPTGEGANYHVIPWGDDIRSSWQFGDGGIRTDDTDAGEHFSFRPYYYSSQSLPLVPGKYTLTLRAHITGERVIRAEVTGLGQIDICSTTNTLHPFCDHRDEGWQSYALTVVNPTTATRTIAIRGLYVSNDAPPPYDQPRDGAVRVSDIEFKHNTGPNLLIRSNPNTHLYVDQRNAALLDLILSLSEELGIYHKLTVFHKNDAILNRFREQEPYSANFYSDPTAVWYERAYTRYFLARWGSSSALHSLELANENHLTEESYEAGWSFADYVHTTAPRPLLVSNSFWGWWVASFFSDPRVDYGDKHWYARQGESEDPELVSWLWYDSAAYVRECQTRFREYDYNKPLVRGEGGVWPESGFDQHPDINGLYYHKALWAQIGGPFCWGEWYPHLFPDQFGLLDMFTAFERFMDTERPYHYQDLELQDGDLRAWGMRWDGRVLLWIDNRLHTWKRVADSEPVLPASGTITIPDMEGDWLVQWWDTATGTVTQQTILHADGNLALTVHDLTDDVAVKAIPNRLFLPLAARGSAR